MYRYGSSGSDPQPLDDPSNLIALRRDLHYLFDTRRFTFVPRRETETEPPQVAVYTFSSNDNTELIPLLHNRLPQPLSGISTENIFARFAWTIFSDQHLHLFKGMAEYAVLMFDPETGISRVEKLRSIQVRSKLKVFDAYPRSRSASPRKRVRDPSAHDDIIGLEDDEDSVSDDDSGSLVSGWESNEEGDEEVEEIDYEPPRGRRRKRSWDYNQGDSPPELTHSFLSTSSHDSKSHDAARSSSEEGAVGVALPVKCQDIAPEMQERVAKRLCREADNESLVDDNV